MKTALLFIFLPGLALAREALTLLPDSPILHSPAVTEASGLAVSSRNPDFLWIVNDSGGTPEIHLFQTDGTPRGSIRVSGVKNKDWEDLSSFTLNGTPYLLVADTGDNSAKRNSVTVHILPEPKLPTGGSMLSSKQAPSWSISFTYEGGPRDCEAVAVDAKAEKILLVTKRDKIPELHELPLRSGKKAAITKRLGTTRVIAPAVSFLPFRNQPTGLDISAAGTRAAIVTYYGVFVFNRAPDESWSDALSRKPDLSAAHLLHQAESVAFSKDATTVFTVSEGKTSPIARFRIGD